MPTMDHDDLVLAGLPLLVASVANAAGQLFLGGGPCRLTRTLK